MNSSRHSVGLWLGVLVLAAGCSDPVTAPPADGGGTDGAIVDGGDVDGAIADGGDVDGAIADGGDVIDGGDVDTGIADIDLGVIDLDAALVCAAGVECTNYAAALATAERGATAIANCVIQLHQSDCCGATDANGINHDARTTLCSAEASCVAMYSTPAGCSDATITTDTGETTTVAGDVRLRVVDGLPCTFDPTITCYTCETFVCATGACRSAPGIAGGCAP